MDEVKKSSPFFAKGWFMVLIAFIVGVVPTSTGSMPSMAPAKVKRFSPMVT